MATSADDFVGSVIGGYRIERVIGTGGTGAVYLGRNEDPPHDEAAIKVLMPPLQLTAAQREEFERRFKHEALALASLDHPNTLPVRAFGQDAATGLSYLILPYIPGGTLAERIARGQVPLDEATRYATQLGQVLDYAHARGIVHRDVKPANVLLNDDGHAYLVDFSIVRLFDIPHTTVSTAGQVLGTPEYIAPEQVTGAAIGPAADVYGLGLLLYHLVAGRTPFQGNSLIELMNKHVLAEPPTPRQFRPDLPAPAAGVILRALAKRPADRFASAGELVQAFVAGVQGRWTPGVSPDPPVHRGAEPIGLPPDVSARLRLVRNPVAVITAAVVAAIVIAVVVVFSAQLIAPLLANLKIG